MSAESSTALPGARTLGLDRQLHAWALEVEGGWVLVGAPAGTAKHLHEAGLDRSVRAIMVLDTHTYHTDGLGEVVRLTRAPVYALPEALPTLGGADGPPDEADAARGSLLARPLAALLLALRGRPAPIRGLRPLVPGASPAEAPGLQLLPIDGLAPGAAVLLDESRGYVVLGSAASGGWPQVRLPPSREIVQHAAFQRSLRAALARPLSAALFQLGAPLVGESAIAELRRLVEG